MVARVDPQLPLCRSQRVHHCPGQLLQCGVVLRKVLVSHGQVQLGGGGGGRGGGGYWWSSFSVD